MLILIDNQTKIASDEFKELDFYMSFKNGILCCTVFYSYFPDNSKILERNPLGFLGKLSSQPFFSSWVVEAAQAGGFGD